MKALILTVIVGILIMAGCRPYGSMTCPEPSSKIAELITRSPAYGTHTPIRCPFIQAGSF